MNRWIWSHSLCRSIATIATTIDVWMYVNLSVKELVYEVPIEEFNSHRVKLDVEYRNGLEVMRGRKTQVE